ALARVQQLPFAPGRCVFGRHLDAGLNHRPEYFPELAGADSTADGSVDDSAVADVRRALRGVLWGSAWLGGPRQQFGVCHDRFAASGGAVVHLEPVQYAAL